MLPASNSGARSYVLFSISTTKVRDLDNVLLALQKRPSSGRNYPFLVWCAKDGKKALPNACHLQRQIRGQATSHRICVHRK